MSSHHRIYSAPMTKNKKCIQITVCTNAQYEDIVGLHLTNPDVKSLSDAASTAVSIGHSRIFIRIDSVGDKYKMSPMVMNKLLELNASKWFKLHFNSVS